MRTAKLLENQTNRNHFKGKSKTRKTNFQKSEKTSKKIRGTEQWKRSKIEILAK